MVGNRGVRKILGETVEKAGQRPVYLRVVTRVYLAGAVMVALSRADATGAGARGGNAPPVPMIDGEGNVQTNYQAVLNALNAQANSVATVSAAGGAVQFVGVSESSVALAESFDRLLAVGYLGFDVPVYPGGELGAPVPTFQRLNGKIPEPPRTKVGPLTLDQQRFRVNQGALAALAKTNSAKAMKVMESLLAELKATEFADAQQALKAAQNAQGGSDAGKRFEALLTAFQEASLNYVTLAGSQGIRYARYDRAFVRAYDQKDNQP